MKHSFFTQRFLFDVCSIFNKKLGYFILVLWDCNMKRSLKILVSCIWVCILLQNQGLHFQKISSFNCFKKSFICFLLNNPFFNVANWVLILFDNSVDIRRVKRSVCSNFHTSVCGNHTGFSIIWGGRLSGKHRDHLNVFHDSLRFCILICFVNLIIGTVMRNFNLWFVSRLFICGETCNWSLL